MANIITTLFQMDTKGGVKSLSDLRTELKNTEGVTGKAKVGLKGMGDFLKTHAAEGALAAGTAIAAFGVKSIQAFQDTAIEAGKFADATGLSTEASSRWIEVANDVGVSTETMQGVFLRLNKAIGDGAPVLKQYGIEAQKTADGQVDVNATMLEAIKRVGDIKDPTERAAAAQKLFGRSYAEASEIVFASADGLARKLEDVSDAKVINEDELAKARDMREAMDNFKDAIEEVQIALGSELAPKVTENIKLFLDLKKSIESVVDNVPGLREVASAVQAVLNPVATVGKAFRKTRDDIDDLIDSEKELRGDLVDLGSAAVVTAASTADVGEATQDYGMYAEYAAGMAVALADAAEEQEQAQKDATEAAKRQNDALAEQVRTTEELIDKKIELIGGDIAVRNAQRDAKAAGEELNAVLEDQESTLEDAAVAIDNATEANLNAAEAAAQYEIDQREANGETLTARDRANIYRDSLQELAGQLDGPVRDAILNYIATLDKIPSEKTTIITATGARVGVTSGGAKRPAPGGGAQSMTQGFAPTAGAPGGTVINMVVNAGMGTDGRQVGRQIKEALAAYERGGGR